MAFKDTFSDRRDAAAKAKQALLEKFRARAPEDDPELQARKEARRAVVEAREQRQAERKRAKEEEAARLAAEKAAAEAEAARLAAEEIASAKDLLAKQKAARDARYAARKQRR